MSRLKGILFPGFLVLLVSVLILKAHNASAVAPRTCSSSWNLVTSPNPGPNASSLAAVAALSTHAVWAVGDYASSGGVDQTLTMRWNGTGWKKFASPSPGNAQNGLLGVDRVPGSITLWAVGYSSTMVTYPQQIYQTLIEFWNGTSWSVMSSPNPSASNDTLTGVSALSSTDVWAVGYYAESSGYNDQALIEHWDGSNWSVVASPNPGSSTRLYAIKALSASDIWAVGYEGDSSQTQTLTEHWNGTSWKIVASPSPGTDGNYLYGIASVPHTSHVWAVGYDTTTSDNVLIEYWTGIKWKVVAGANPSSSLNVLNSITSLSASGIWAVGYSDDNSGNEQTLVERWDGTQWSLVSSPNAGPANNDLESIARVPGTAQLWAVGPYFNNGSDSTLTERYC